MEDLRLLSATRIAQLIRDGVISSREAVDAHIEQVERVNPQINALVAQRFEAARREADAADERAKFTPREMLAPLHGVPCTVKEAFALEGMPNSSGLLHRKGIVSSEDATAVKRLRAAGAIPLGMTNTAELCMWIESNNNVYGRTNNPYDVCRTAGGSSGGEGAIVGAGASPFGLGSDVAGSIRSPAFFNGVFGHKATGTMVPGTGQFPMAENEALRYLSSGPLARRAEDLMPLLRVLAGPDGADKHCQEWQLGDPEEVDLEGRTLVVIEDNGKAAVSREMRRAQRRAAKALEARGMVVKRPQIKGLRKQANIWMAAMTTAGETTLTDLLSGDRRVRPALEILKWAVGRSDHTLMVLLLSLLEGLPEKVPGYTDKCLRLGHELKEALLEELGDDGVMLYPPYTTAAPVHNRTVASMFSLKMPVGYTAILNYLEFPVTQVPLGLNRKGLPLGVQVVSAPGNDHVTIAVAMRLEGVFGGWTPPPIARVGVN